MFIGSWIHTCERLHGLPHHTQILYHLVYNVFLPAAWWTGGTAGTLVRKIRANSGSTLISCAEVKVGYALSELLHHFIFRAIVRMLQSASASKCNIRVAYHPIPVSILDPPPIDLS